MSRNRPRRWLACAILSMAMFHVDAALSQQMTETSVRWAYASYFGTGWYRVGDQQSAFIASLAPRWFSGEVESPKSADQRAKYTVRAPVTVGVAQLNFENVPGILDPENFSTVSAGLRADLDVPVTTRFSVRPSAQLSFGTVIGESDYAWTYRGDLRGRYTFRAGNLDWALIGAAGFIDYDTASVSPATSARQVTFEATNQYSARYTIRDEQK